MSKPHTLTGQSTAGSRFALQELAADVAAQYFGTACVGVELHDASAEHESAKSYQATVAVSNSFTADWVAIEKHRYQHPGYGFPKCTRCGKEDTR